MAFFITGLRSGSWLPNPLAMVNYSSFGPGWEPFIMERKIKQEIETGLAC